MNPLAIEIWFFIALGYILVSFCIWIVARLSPVEWVSSKTTCSTACVHKIQEIRKTNHLQEELELKSFPNEFQFQETKCIDDFADQTEKNDGNESDDTVELVSVNNEFTLKNSFWFAIGALMQQGADLYPRVWNKVLYYLNCSINWRLLNFDNIIHFHKISFAKLMLLAKKTHSYVEYFF